MGLNLDIATTMMSMLRLQIRSVNEMARCEIWNIMIHSFCREFDVIDWHTAQVWKSVTVHGID